MGMTAHVPQEYEYDRDGIQHELNRASQWLLLFRAKLYRDYSRDIQLV